MARHFGKALNATLSDQAQYGYKAAQAEGAARTHFLTPAERFDRYISRYAVAKREGRTQAARAIKHMANRLTESKGW